MSYLSNPMTNLAMTPLTSQSSDGTDKKGKGGGSWFEALSRAWGEALDRQAETIQGMSDALDQGADTPSAITELTAASMKFGFMTTEAHTGQTSISDGLNKMGGKQ